MKCEKYPLSVLKINRMIYAAVYFFVLKTREDLI